MPIIINTYIARQFCYYLLIVLISVACVVMVFDIIELTRVSAGKFVPFSKVLIMSWQKNLLHMQKVIGFLVLIATIITYSKLARTSELIILKSGGLSIWQFMFPSLIISFVLGIIVVSILSPITSYNLSNYQKMEAQFLKGGPSLLSLSKTGLWMMQSDTHNNQSIIHALRISESTQELSEVTFYFIDDKTRFTKRVDGATAKLENGFWRVHKARVTEKGSLNVLHNMYLIPTTINFSQIKESLNHPETLSFWKLPHFIDLAEASGLSVTKYKLYYYKLLMTPVFFLTMVMLGTAFSLTLPRLGKTSKMFFLVILIGFGLYFISDLIFAFGTNGLITLGIAALSPSIITAMIALYCILHFEEV